MGAPNWDIEPAALLSTEVTDVAGRIKWTCDRTWVSWRGDVKISKLFLGSSFKAQLNRLELHHDGKHDTYSSRNCYATRPTPDCWQLSQIDGAAEPAYRVPGWTQIEPIYLRYGLDTAHGLNWCVNFLVRFAAAWFSISRASVQAVCVIWFIWRHHCPKSHMTSRTWLGKKAYRDQTSQSVDSHCPAP